MGTLNNFIPYKITEFFKSLPQTHPIGFSMPAEKITRVTADSKLKLFPDQLIDEEIANNVTDKIYNPLGSDQRYFETESDYYEDLQLSKYGITGKRGGWECMRHYEMAGNGSVLCFKNLKNKPFTCAPHGLNETNCIDYKDYKDLMQKINSVTTREYEQLLYQTYKWVEENTTTKRVEQVLNICFP